MPDDPAPLAPRPARPTGVTLIAVLAFLAGGAMLLGALLLAFGGAALAGAFSTVLPPWLNGVLGAVAVVFAVVLVALAALYVAGGVGLLLGAPWAWMVTLVLAGLGAINSLFTLPAGIVGLALNLFVVWYFFTPPVKAFFGKSHVQAFWERRAGA